MEMAICHGITTCLDAKSCGSPYLWENWELFLWNIQVPFYSMNSKSSMWVLNKWQGSGFLKKNLRVLRLLRIDFQLSPPLMFLALNGICLPCLGSVRETAAKSTIVCTLGIWLGWGRPLALKAGERKPPSHPQQQGTLLPSPLPLDFEKHHYINLCISQRSPIVFIGPLFPGICV